MKIGVLGGSFNPIHTGHLILAEQIREAATLAKVLFVPANFAPHKTGAGLASGDDRLEMVRLALAGNPFFEASEIELRRGGVSYTIDTIRELRRQNPDDAFFFIIGADSVPELPSWYKTAELVELCTFLIGERPGHPIRWEPLERILPAAKVHEMRRNVLSTIQIGICATDVRERVRQGRTIRYLVPERVEQYIAEHGLYEEQK